MEKVYPVICKPSNLDYSEEFGKVLYYIRLLCVLVMRHTLLVQPGKVIIFGQNHLPRFTAKRAPAQEACDILVREEQCATVALPRPYSSICLLSNFFNEMTCNTCLQLGN
jgi:hypothetical protein